MASNVQQQHQQQHHHLNGVLRLLQQQQEQHGDEQSCWHRVSAASPRQRRPDGVRRRLQHRPQQQQQQQQQQLYRHLRLSAAAATTTTTATTTALVAICLCLLVALGGDVVDAEGNVGCHFVKTLCLERSEVCFDDNIFGKCIPTTGVDVEDVEKTPLTEDESRILATMLEEMQGAGLGWDHPFVQCRIQSTLYSLQKQTPIPPNLCSNLAPNPDSLDPAGALALVRFTPPNEGRLYRANDEDAQFYRQPPPPLFMNKKSRAGHSPSHDLNSILHQLQQLEQLKQLKQLNHRQQQQPETEPELEQRQLRHDPLELAHFGGLGLGMEGQQQHQLESPGASSVMDAFLERERERIRLEQLRNEAEREADRKQALRNRLQLYQMLAGSEPDPQPYQRRPSSPVDPAAEEEAEERTLPFVAAELEDSNEMYFPENYAPFKRAGGNARHQAARASSSSSTSTSPSSSTTFFRELAGEQAAAAAVAPRRRPTPKSRPLGSELDNDIEFMQTGRGGGGGGGESDAVEQEALRLSLLHNSLTPFEEEAILAANSYPQVRRRPQHRRPDSSGVYTEGGLVFVPERGRLQQQGAGDEVQQEAEAEVEAEAEEAEAEAEEEAVAEAKAEQKREKARILLANMLGFTRHERLDVKKPGPLLGPPPPPANAIEATATNHNRNRTQPQTQAAETKEVLPEHIKGSGQASKKKKVVQDHSDEDHGQHTVDTEYAHVVVKNPIDSWSDGVRIMNELANILHMQGYFNYLTVQQHEVSFRVDSNNPERKTAADVARTINENRGVKNNILRRLGVTVLRAGVGHMTKRSDGDGGDVSSSRIELAEQGPDVTHIMAYMFAGAGAAAVIVIFVTLILIKRHDKKRDKLGGLQTAGGIGAAESCSKDYQDLCRARMAGKAGGGGGSGGGGGGGDPVPSGRITSLSKENDRPPSSRSSTSSWSEEPALTNMDISTGHMVLSYMEDHLRNKGRLQREWEALCRYEAEPSARDAALQPQCASLNRPGAPLPYDHSRVVLNHLANAEGLDYINASTITDHDPRAPAYVAAQGPLPTTLAHFWQMIWEQGAVVIVALCRLQENGEIACARYWPEEGAEVYHIYEVHLVSEHIWCDDYLVRSFYLKNLRTSETRTVTQFHFLSWPQGGVPAQPKALLDFRRKVNKSYRGRSCPIVVHGSSGAGRTGAYILLDLVLGRMNKGAREIDIAATLEHLRDQRAGVVATRQQFEFVLMAVAEEVHAILKALPANQSNEKRDLEADKKEATSATTATGTSATGGTTGTLKEERETAEEAAPAAATTTATTSEATTSAKAQAEKEREREEHGKGKAKGAEREKEKAKNAAPSKKK